MYQKRVQSALSARAPSATAEVDEAMWALFLAIGDYWMLTDDVTGYRGRLQAFMANRISLDVGYLGYYALAAQVVEELQADVVAPAAAYARLFTARPSGGEEDSDLATVKAKVVDEFITWRLALGGFRDFGALNYRGYFGGANLSDEPVPYRTRNAD